MTELTDKEIVESLLQNREDVIDYLFKKKCKSLFNYIAHNVFDYKIDQDELINELYIYLADKDWHILRQFRFKSKLITWLSVVSARYFIKKRNLLIDSSTQTTLYDKTIDDNLKCDRNIDIRNAISMMPNKRYQDVIIALELDERSLESVATEMGVTIDNLYNIRRRARNMLSLIITKKEDY